MMLKLIRQHRQILIMNNLSNNSFLKFDIKSNPPTDQEILNEISRIQKEGVKLKRIYNFINRMPIFVIALTVYFTGGIYTVYLTIFFCAIFAYLWYANNIFYKKYQLSFCNTIKALTPLTDQDNPDCQDLLKYCEDSPQVNTYFQEVVKQGRKVLTGEFTAIKKWFDSERRKK